MSEHITLVNIYTGKSIRDNTELRLHFSNDRFHATLFEHSDSPVEIANKLIDLGYDIMADCKLIKCKENE